MPNLPTPTALDEHCAVVELAPRLPAQLAAGAGHGITIAWASQYLADLDGGGR